MPGTDMTISMEALRARSGAKWRYFPADVLPLWVAEMDYAIAGEVKAAIAAHLETDDLGYPMFGGAPGLHEAVVTRFAERYGVSFPVEGVDSSGSTVAGMVNACRALTEPGDEVLLLTPLYPPFKRTVIETGRTPVEVELVRRSDRYEIDWDALRAAVTPRTSLLMLCNPHNPIGHMYSRDDQARLGEVAMENDLYIVSDELHADISYGGEHVPIASVSDDVAKRTITLYGPTKAFNIPGLGISFSLVTDPSLLERLSGATGGVSSWPSRLAEVAARAAYTEAEPWLTEVLAYLKDNRDHLVTFVRDQLPSVSMHVPEATYLAWLDLRGFDLGEKPAGRLTETAKVGLSEGADFGKGGEGFVRLNYATSREILDEALGRLAGALR